MKYGESWGGRLRVPKGRARCWTETDSESERRATNRALGADEDDDDGEEEARERRKAAGTGGGERRDAAIGRALCDCRVRGPRRSPVRWRLDSHAQCHWVLGYEG